MFKPFDKASAFSCCIVKKTFRLFCGNDFFLQSRIHPEHKPTTCGKPRCGAYQLRLVSSPNKGFQRVNDPLAGVWGQSPQTYPLTAARRACRATARYRSRSAKYTRRCTRQKSRSTRRRSSAQSAPAARAGRSSRIFGSRGAAGSARSIHSCSSRARRRPGGRRRAGIRACTEAVRACYSSRSPAPGGRNGPADRKNSCWP